MDSGKIAVKIIFTAITFLEIEMVKIIDARHKYLTVPTTKSLLVEDKDGDVTGNKTT